MSNWSDHNWLLLVLSLNIQSSMTSTQLPVRLVAGHWPPGINDLTAFRWLHAVCAAGALVAMHAAAAPAIGGRAGVPDMDYGSMLTYTVGLPEVPGRTNANLALKGVCVRLANAPDSTICFDTDLLRYYAGWSGGWLDLSRTHLTMSKGSYHALIQGDVQFRAALGPGWDQSEEFVDRRPLTAGPLPAEQGRYLGLVRHGANVAFHYRIAGTEIYDSPDGALSHGVTVFRRTLHLAPSTNALYARVCDVPLREPQGEPDGAEAPLQLLVNEASGQIVGVRVVGEGTRLRRTPGGRIYAMLPARSTAGQYAVLFARGTRSAVLDALNEAAQRSGPDVTAFTAGGPARWPEVSTVSGRIGQDVAAYTVDTVPIPEKNPWRSWMRLTALDFFADGRAAVATWSGDIWIVSGLEAGLERVHWRRFAAGLFEPLGLRIVAGQLYVLCRDQLMRLEDRNGDGEADVYECVNNDTWLSPSYHAFAFDLQTDRAGNFYYTRCGQRVDPVLPLNGGMVRVTRDGARAEMFATGLRAANGMAIGPNDEIVCGDNQGNWVPASRLNWIRPGGFYGYMPHARRVPPPTDYDPPLCWLPMVIDNSSGGQLWAPEGWGPLSGQLLHTSYGKGSLFAVLVDEVAGVKQGGVVPLRLKFDAGIMRARVHPRDGQVWVCGLKGWETGGGRDGALQRVRYTGRPALFPHAMHVMHDAIRLSFTGELDPSAAGDAENYAVEQWNYRWSEQYGSPEYSVEEPKRVGHDAVTMRRVTVSADHKSVTLEIPGLSPVMQMKIRLRLKSAAGAPVEHEIYNTINRVPEG